MINQIFNNDSLSQNLESEILELYRVDLYETKVLQTAVSLAIYWTECQGTLDGEIIIYTSIDSENWALAETISIDSTSNTDDILVFLIDPYLKYLKILVNHNGISSGNLFASLSFSGV